MRLKLRWIPVIIALPALCAWSAEPDPGLHGSIQIQTSKTIEGSGNVDQLFGRANLLWAFQEKTAKEVGFSSLIHMRVYPAGFGFEPLLGASFASGTDTSSDTPAIPNRTPPNAGLPTTQMYQAWVRYRFPDFDIRVGRLVTHESKSLHFGNYLDFNSGGKLTFSRDGIHNALEFFKSHKMFLTKAHLGIGDAIGNRGFLRLHETITLRDRLVVGLGYRVNIFDLIYHDFNDDANLQLTNTVAVSLQYPASSYLDGFLEIAWSHVKGDRDTDPVPVLAGWDLNVKRALGKTPVAKVVDVVRIEGEYLLNRYEHEGAYQGVDRDLLWNVYFEKSWKKRMHFQVSLFAAPTPNQEDNAGAGVRFTSGIN